MENEQKTTTFKNSFREQNWIFLTKPHFNLRNPNGCNPTTVFLVFRVNGKQYKVSLGVKVIPSHWDKKQSRALISCALCEMENVNNMRVNSKISEVLLAYQNFLSYLCNQNEFDIKNSIDKFFIMAKRSKRKKELLSATLFSGLRKSDMKESSFNSYMRNIKQFTDWISDIKKDATIDDVTEDLLFQYKEYLFSQKGKHKYTDEMVSPQNNTVSDKFKKLSTVFVYCGASTDIFKKVIRSIKTFKQDENQIYITEEEVNVLRNIELNGVDDEVRDLFLFQLSVAQRISDISVICGKHLEVKDRKCSIVQKKTNTKVVFPIDDLAHSILIKYNYVLPCVNYRTLEDHLKKICKTCGFNEKITCYELRNSKSYEFTVEKWEMVGTHSARRTFISDGLKNGQSGEILRKITGHKSAAFSRYNRLSSEDAADIYLKNNSKSHDGVTDKHPQEEISTSFNPLKQEIREVLTMFSVPSVEWIELDDVESLYRVLITYENDICDKIGCDYSVLKNLFNRKDLSLRDKVQVIKELINNKS